MKPIDLPPDAYVIVKNSVYCNICEEEIESKHRHDFVWCKGQHVFVDGGKDYLRRGGDFSKCEDTSVTKLAQIQQETQDTSE